MKDDNNVPCLLVRDKMRFPLIYRQSVDFERLCSICDSCIEGLAVEEPTLEHPKWVLTLRGDALVSNKVM